MTPITFDQLLQDVPHPVGTWVKMSAPEGVEILALAGFDFVVIDLEHSPLSLETASTLVTVARGRGIVPFVRCPDHGQSWIQRSLDMGAAGVLVPHVDTEAEARAVVTAGRHAPAGQRGVGPTTRAGDWGLRPMGEYLSASPDTALILQLESAGAIENAHQIAATGTSALFVGPADLSVAMGVPVGDERVTELMFTALHAAHDAGVPCGTAVGTPEQARDLADRGFDFVLVSNDATILGTAARGAVTTFKTPR